jgi:hypothetical protein
VPYRRLPKTDVSRLNALSVVIQIADTVEMNQLAYSSKHIHPLRNMFQNLESAKTQQVFTWDQLVRQNKTYQNKLSKTRIYLTHFLQVINMCIAREELSPDVRKYFHIDPADGKIPALLTEEAILTKGKIVIEGENRRINEGGSPIMTPTIGKVNAWYEQFKEDFHSQKTIQKSNKRANDKIKLVREQTDTMILEVWNDVEKYYSGLPDEEKRDACRKYGLKYVFRKNEKGDEPKEGQ